MGRPSYFVAFYIVISDTCVLFQLVINIYRLQFISCVDDRKFLIFKESVSSLLINNTVSFVYCFKELTHWCPKTEKGILQTT